MRICYDTNLQELTVESGLRTAAVRYSDGEVVVENEDFLWTALQCTVARSAQDPASKQRLEDFIEGFRAKIGNTARTDSVGSRRYGVVDLQRCWAEIVTESLEKVPQSTPHPALRRLKLFYRKAQQYATTTVHRRLELSYHNRSGGERAIVLEGF